MHHPREAVIDGVKFVLIREELLEELKDAIGDVCVHAEECATHSHQEHLKDLYKRLGEL